LTPFSQGLNRYSADDLNIVFQALIGEATPTDLAHELVYGPIDIKMHAKEAVGIASAIFNSADYDFNNDPDLFRSGGSVTGFVTARDQVKGYQDGVYRGVWNRNVVRGQLAEGTEFCQ
jgi:hypothetical protein